ncbi:MAG: pseudouridine synthase [Candidatus Kapabacteria bacterium]|nr:pseudouridine synthase [Candidatus Kapabacteria bacterium]
MKREDSSTFKKFERKGSTPFQSKERSNDTEKPRSSRGNDSRSKTPFQKSERTETAFKKPFRQREDGDSSERPRSSRGSEFRSNTPFQRSERTETAFKKPFRQREERDSSEKPRSTRGSDTRSKTPFQRSERTETAFKKPFRQREDGDSSERPRSTRNNDSRPKTPYKRTDRSDSKRFEKSSRRDVETVEPLTVRLKSAPVKISKAHSEYVDEENKEKRVYVKSTPGKRYTARRPSVLKKRGEIKKTTLSTKSKLSVSSMLENAPIRLNKFIADGGVASRRTADELIESGKVTVNGAIVIDLGSKVTKTDLVAVNGEPVSFQKHLTYILLNKPKDVITTVSDELKRKTVFDIVKIHTRLFPVGRLDRNTTGALLLTNDGELAYRLTHPKFEVPREYIVKVDKKISLEDAKKISEGLELEDGLTSPCVIYVDPLDKHRARLEIKEGKNREVRRMFEYLGYDVKSLDRKSYSFLTTKGLDRGQYRHLTRYEIDRLRSILGLEDTLY